jgi:hypothetical protein
VVASRGPIVGNLINAESAPAYRLPTPGLQNPGDWGSERFHINLLTLEIIAARILIDAAEEESAWLAEPVE